MSDLKSQIAAGKAKPVYEQSDKSFTGKLVLTVLLLFMMYLPGLIASFIFANEAKRYPDAPGAKGLIWLNRIVFAWFMIVVLLVVCSVIAAPSMR